MGSKRKSMKCECGGLFQEELKEIQGIYSEVMVCSSCDEIIFTLEQSRKFHKLKSIQEALVKEARKIGKVGNSMGITLPVKLKELGFDVGEAFDLKLIDANKLLIELRPHKSN